MNNFMKKWLIAPATNEVKKVEVVKLWYVRWTSRHGSFHSEVRQEVEAFPSFAAAEEFAEALRSAFKLVRHSDKAETHVSVGEGSA